MYLTIIYVVLSITCAALADFSGTTDVLPRMSTWMPALPLPSCEKLNIVNETHLLDPAEFKETLEYCSRDSQKRNVTFVALVLLTVYEAISKKQCSFIGASEVENQLIDCVNQETNTLPISTADAKSHFGLNNTFSLQFRYDECNKSVKTSNCVEKVLSAKKWDAKMKVCKDNIIRGFQVTSKLCSDAKALLRDDKGSGHAILPTNLLIFSATLIVVKVMSSGF